MITRDRSKSQKSRQNKKIYKRSSTPDPFSDFSTKNYNEKEGLKSNKTLKSNVYLLNQKDKNALKDLEAKAYEIELETNRAIPRYFKNLLDISPSRKNKYYELIKQLKIIDSLLCLCSLISMGFAVLDTNLVATNYNILTNNFIITDFNNAARGIVIFMNIFSVFLIIRRYRNHIDVHKLKEGKIANLDNVFSLGLFWQMIIEILINSVFNPPVVDAHFFMNGSIYVSYDYSEVFNITNLIPVANANNTNLKSPVVSVKLYYNVSPIITFVILLRIYHFLRVIYTFSYWNSLQAKEICNNLTCKADLSFGLRAYLKLKPFLSLSISVVFCIIFFGLAVQISEYYNKPLINTLNDSSINGFYVDHMRKFESFYNTLWLILVTMTTIGYGDIVPTTYFGRVLAICACIFGTFVMSLLVLFLNNKISFDEVEKHVYNTIVEEKFSMKAIQKESIKMIYKALEYNYLRKKHPESTALYRFKLLNVDLRFMSKQFKANRMKNLKAEVDIDEILGAIKYSLDFNVNPFKIALDEYNKERIIFDHSYDYLKDSSGICDKYIKNSMQIANLLKIMDKQKYLDDLQTIDDVYDSQVNMVEEIICYHKMKDQLDKITGGSDKSVDSKDKIEDDETESNGSIEEQNESGLESNDNN